MLEINVVLTESYDEKEEKFVADETVKVVLEHSLFTLSKWEAVWEQAFLGKQEKTREQVLSYIETMILTPEIPRWIFEKLIGNHLEEINKYIGSSMSATKLRSDPNAPMSREVVTAELIYYWMVTMNIPIELEHWHLNRLMTLIRVINLKNTPAKAMSARQRKELNEARRKQIGSRG